MKSTQHGQHQLTVSASTDMEIPGCTVQVISASVNDYLNVNHLQEGLFEPAEKGKIPTHFSLAQSLSQLTPDGQVILQVMNTKSYPLKIYKDTVLGMFTRSQHISVVKHAISNQDTDTDNVTNLTQCVII